MSAKVLPVSNRIPSIDLLRGFTMFWLIGGELGHTLVVSFLKVIFAGKVPEILSRHLTHCDWIGFHAWDLVMPMFLFVTGLSLPFSMGKIQHSKSSQIMRVLRRVGLLWIFGMIMQGNLLSFRLEFIKPFSNTLQAIAVGYLIAALIMIWSKSAKTLWIWAGSLLVIWWAILEFVPFAGNLAGTLSPMRNLPLWLDHQLLGKFQDGTNYAWILPSLGFGASVLIGSIAGSWMKNAPNLKRRLLGLVSGGVGCLVLGGLLHFNQPIIKHLWTSSMVLWASGLCLLILAAFDSLVNLKKLRNPNAESAQALSKWSIFWIVMGANSLLAYMMDSLFLVTKIGQNLFGGLANLITETQDQRRFVIALLTFISCWLFLFFLYRKKAFLRV